MVILRTIVVVVTADIVLAEIPTRSMPRWPGIHDHRAGASLGFGKHRSQLLAILLLSMMRPARDQTASKRPDRHKAPRRPSQDHHDTRRAPRTPSRQQESQQAPGRQSTRKQRGRCQLLFPKYLRIERHARNVFSQGAGGTRQHGGIAFPPNTGVFREQPTSSFREQKVRNHERVELLRTQLRF